MKKTHIVETEGALIILMTINVLLLARFACHPFNNYLKKLQFTADRHNTIQKTKSKLYK